MKKKCKYCKEKFETQNKVKIFCKALCGQKFHQETPKGRKRIRDWQIKNQERCNQRHREWNKRNPEFMKRMCLKRESNDIEHQKIRRATRYKHGKPTKCMKCPSTKGIQYHHKKPYDRDKFLTVCRKCHLKEHGIFNCNSFNSNEGKPSYSSNTSFGGKD